MHDLCFQISEEKKSNSCELVRGRQPRDFELWFLMRGIDKSRRDGALATASVAIIAVVFYPMTVPFISGATGGAIGIGFLVLR